MSELKKTRDVATYQKLEPPKSLRGEEDADVTWDLIVQRYPNAAPLLCQMETVIERAEGLLLQLRSTRNDHPPASDNRGTEDLTTSRNVNESTEVSMISEQDSRLASDENMTPEVDSLEDRISVDRGEPRSASDQIFSVQTSLDASSSSMVISSSKSPPVSEMEMERSRLEQESTLCADPSVNEAGEKSAEGLTLEGRSSSLEAWGKVVGEDVDHTTKRLKTTIESSPGGMNSKEDSVSEHTRRLSALKNGPMQQITKLNILGRKDELMQRFAGTIATASKVLDTTRIVEQNEEVAKHFEPVPDVESSEKNINESGESGGGGSSVKKSENVEPPDGISETLSKPVKNEEVLGNGDEVILGPRTAVQILDEYSKICGISVEYAPQSPSCSLNKISKNSVVRCSFYGFAFEACAQGKKNASKDAAAKVLRCLAGRQIDGENMNNLKPFTRKQMKEIINLGNGGECETAVRKLYKICLELDEPEPVYTVHEAAGVATNRYTVKCVALGITTTGYGIRRMVAKRVAADLLLQTYHKNISQAR